MSKHVPLSVRPNKANADAWVKSASETQTPLTKAKPVRLTMEIAPDLHRRLKRRCFDQEIHISEFVRALIDRALASE